MEHCTMLAMFATEHCTTIAVLIMTIIIAWLVKQVELLQKEIYIKPKIENNYTQTECEHYPPSERQDNTYTIKKRRSHRGGKPRYLKEWPGSYPQ